MSVVEDMYYFDEEDCYAGEGVLWRRDLRLARGAYSIVYLAKPVFGASLPPLMAVKSTILYDVFCEEKKVLETLGDCPFIIKYLGSDTTRSSNPKLRGSFELIFEYASGGSLRNLLDNQPHGRGLPETDVRRYVRDVVRGLVHIHSSGYVHCDIKPDNILLVPSSSSAAGSSSSDFVAKIGDFGLTKPVNEGLSKRGTEGYLAPETINYQQQEPPSDIWSLGCTLDELLQGTGDYGDEDVTDSIIPTTAQQISRKAMDFIKACIDPEPELRWTAEMLLKHPFLSDEDEEEEETNCSTTARNKRNHVKAKAGDDDHVETRSARKRKLFKAEAEEEETCSARKKRKVAEFIEACMELMAEDRMTAHMVLQKPLVDGLIEMEQELKIKGRRKRSKKMMMSQLISNIISC